MKRFEVTASILGTAITTIEAESEPAALEIFLTRLKAVKNCHKNWSASFDNVILIVDGDPVLLEELNLAFPRKLTEHDIEYWTAFDAMEVDEQGNVIL
jgi:hypothetical protein